MTLEGLCTNRDRGNDNYFKLRGNLTIILARMQGYVMLPSPKTILQGNRYMQHFPEELILFILTHPTLSLGDKLRATLVCRQWHDLLQSDLQKTAWQQKVSKELGESSLWQHLPSIARREYFSEYVLALSRGNLRQSILLRNKQFQAQELIQRFWDNTIPENLHGEYALFSCELPRSEDVLIQQAQFILDNVNQYQSGDFSKQPSLASFLTFRSNHEAEQQVTLLAYQKLENQLAGMVMLMDLYKEMENAAQRNFWDILCNPQTQCWFKGCDLVRLNKLHYNFLINNMLSLHLTSATERSHFSRNSKACFKIIEIFLSRVTPQDWHRHCDEMVPTITTPQAQHNRHKLIELLKAALSQNDETITPHFDIKLLLKLFPDRNEKELLNDFPQYRQPNDACAAMTSAWKKSNPSRPTQQHYIGTHRTHLLFGCATIDAIATAIPNTSPTLGRNRN